MLINFIKTIFGLFFLIILNGCVQSTALLGPTLTLATTGNVLNAGLQLGTNSAFKKETGKDALTFVKDVVEEDHKKKNSIKNLNLWLKKD